MGKTTLLILGLLVCAGATYSQEISKETLCKKWHLDKYIIDAIEYEPEKKEKDDYIYFNIDGSYRTISEGTFEQGTWIVNMNGGYIILKNDKEQTFKVYIISILSEVLMLRYDIQGIGDIDVKYKPLK